MTVRSEEGGGPWGNHGFPHANVAVANATRMAARGVEHRLVERLAARMPSTRPALAQASALLD